tara:strand:+ start:4892 stop:5374 length:483 start_codon:yes stop_codon:yes gene_type:complete
MSGVINFLRGTTAVEGKLFYVGGESIDRDAPASQHYLKCSNPDISPHTCNECEVGWSYSAGSFIKHNLGHNGDDVYSIGEVEVELLRYYNEVAPPDWDQAAYRPFRWISVTDHNSPNVNQTVKVMVDKDNDVWYVLTILKTPKLRGSNYITKLQNQFEEK